MSAEFLKLYRELRHINPDTKAIDATFEKEREQVLRSLGYDVGQDQVYVTRSKYHGKAARRFGLQKRLQALNKDNRVEARKMKELQAIRAKSKEIKSLAEKIQEYSLKSEPIPTVLWTKYNTLHENDTFTDSNIKSGSRNPVNKYPSQPSEAVTVATPSISALQNQSTKMPPNKSLQSLVRPILSVRKNYTSNKWSKEERDRLNGIYHCLNRPPDKNVSAWDAYYVEFTRRFQAFYPTRGHEEIREKIVQMMRLRQMKEMGEEQYWKHMQTQS